MYALGGKAAPLASAPAVDESPFIGLIVSVSKVNDYVNCGLAAIRAIERISSLEHPWLRVTGSMASSGRRVFCTENGNS